MYHNITTENNIVKKWIFLLIILVFSMIFVGGLTRLTHSGLSIVEWKPVTGIIPPLTENDWNNEFNKYKVSPEFEKINFDFRLSDFKSIYFLEYFHRLLARIIGIVCIVPLCFFFYKKIITNKQAVKFLLIFAIGGLQGLIGWIMVKSGLIDNPNVSHYKLALHLLTALLIYALLIKELFSYGHSLIKITTAPKILRLFMQIIIFLIILQITSGAFVAGLDAGIIYNSFPKMGDVYFPSEIWEMLPIYKNFFENPAMVQLIHRVIATVLLAHIACFFWISFNYSLDKKLRYLINLLAIIVIIQVSLGVATLIFIVPITLASLHQVGAIILFTVAILTYYNLQYVKEKTSYDKLRSNFSASNK